MGVNGQYTIKLIYLGTLEAQKWSIAENRHNGKVNLSKRRHTSLECVVKKWSHIMGSLGNFLSVGKKIM